MPSSDVVIVGAVRTPFGRFGGALKEIPSIELGALAIQGVLRQTGVAGDRVEQVFYGSCMPAEYGLETHIPARQALLKAGLPAGTVSLTVDRACCSSMTAVHLAWRTIRSGEAEVALAVGAENMSRTAYLVPSARWGQRIGPITMADPLHELGYRGWNPVARDAGEVAVENGVGRDLQDAWALQSQQRYARALAAGRFADELLPVELPQARGPQLVVDRDEFPKPETTAERLARLPTIYDSPTVTAGNAPGLDTGACAILLMSRRRAEALGQRPLAEVLAVAEVAGEPRQIATVPADAIRKVLERGAIGLEQVDLIEINEAFAAMPLVSTRLLAGGDPQRWQQLQERTNVNGGAVAIGHPVGASGARLVLTLMYELRRRGGGHGVAAICGGLAQGDATLIRALPA